jgi:hypothetical protein
VVNALDEVAETALLMSSAARRTALITGSKISTKDICSWSSWGLWFLGDHMPSNDMKRINGEIMKRWARAEEF